MLKLLRKKGFAKKVLWVIAVIIILSFGVFGTAYLITGNKGGADYAGTIFGKRVSFEDFNKAYQAVYIQALIRFGDKFKELSRFLNLESETWDRLILLHEAKKRNIKINDQEVIRAIEEYPFFQRDGRFDPLLYNDILRYAFRVSARDFEEGTRDNLKFAALFQQITASAAVSEQEILNTFRRENEKVQVSYVLIKPDQFKNDVVSSEDEAKSYYEQNKVEFLALPSVNMDYINLEYPKLEPAEEDKKTEEAPVTTDTKKPVQEKANAIFQDLLVSPDMVAAGQKYNVEVKSSGFFSMEQPDVALGWSYELLDKIFQASEGTVLDPFETSSGMLIVKVRQKKDAHVPEYEEIAGKVKEAVLKKKTKQIAHTKAGEYLEQIKAAFAKTELKDFAQTVKTLGLEIHQTPVFKRGEYLPVVGISKEFQETAFKLTGGNKLSGVAESEIGYCILHLDSYVAADEKEFENRKKTLEESLLNERRTQTFNDFLNQLRLKADITSNIPRQNP